MAKTGPDERVSLLNTVAFQYRLNVYSALAMGLFTCCVLFDVLLLFLDDFVLPSSCWERRSWLVSSVYTVCIC